MSYRKRSALGDGETAQPDPGFVGRVLTNIGFIVTGGFLGWSLNSMWRSVGDDETRKRKRRK